MPTPDAPTPEPSAAEDWWAHLTPTEVLEVYLETADEIRAEKCVAALDAAGWEIVRKGSTVYERLTAPDATNGTSSPSDDPEISVPVSLIEDIVYHYQRYVDPNGYIDNRAHHLIELSNKVSDLGSYHPGFDIETGTYPWERDDG